MNVIVLTPDRVGSSLLQKVITLTMQPYDYGKPVINLHELTNGLELYHSEKYKQTVVGKPEKTAWGYHQSLKEVVSMLDNADHYKVSRLAQYHILNRKDSLNDQLSFYNYINDNFYIISARRENLFEHALSWCIVAFSKNLNVYSHEEKISVFKDLYRKKITIDQEIFKNYLDKYLNYLTWVDNHFRINSIFNYEKDMPNLEEYINGLDIFPNENIKTWEETYGMSWKTWNSCHYLISDMSGFSNAIENKKEILLLENSLQKTTLKNSNSITELGATHQKFVQDNIKQYTNMYLDFQQLVADRTLISGVPIKLQTLAEKAMLVKNFKECVDTYNTWSIKNNRSHQFSMEDLGEAAMKEIEQWYNIK
jgi:hypothetical protein